MVSFTKKKLAILLLTASSLIISCSKDDSEQPGKTPNVDSLSVTSKKVAVGQYIVISPSVKDEDTDNSKLTYSWTGTDGFKSSEAEAKWRPTVTGNHTLTLNVSDGKTSGKKDILFNVVNPDFRLGIWANKYADIQLFESKAGKTVHPASNLLFQIYQGENTTTIDAYAFTNNLLSSASTLFTKTYASTYSQYVTDYNTNLNKLRTKYGTPKSNLIFYKTDSVRTVITTHPELIGDAIVAGDVKLTATWETTSSTVALTIYKSSTSGNLIFGASYIPLSTAPLTASFENKRESLLEGLTNSIKK